MTEFAVGPGGDFDVAYQPIVSMTSLRTYGFEALLRPQPGAPYRSATELLDAAWSRGALPRVEAKLLDGAVGKFARLSFADRTRLFCNVDNRLFGSSRALPDDIRGVAQAHGLSDSNICLELSERTAPESVEDLRQIVEALLVGDVRIAIDDFGTGFSGLHMLMRVQPHYVKIDRFFIDGIAQQPRKQVVVSNLVRLAHSLGFMIVAEGIETEGDFRACRDIGCDLAQGYLVARPSTDLTTLALRYDRVVAPLKRLGEERQSRLADLAEAVSAMLLSSPVGEVIQRFKDQPNTRLIPVVDHEQQPVGAIYETDVKNYLLNPFGHALLANKGVVGSLSKLIARCPTIDIHAPVDAVVDNYVLAGGTDGVILTEDGLYAGFLPSNALLRLVAERDVATARDQNPLTLLPGNATILRHIDQHLKLGQSDCTLVFFDFDSFKAFNDAYGFLHGDRALRLFAEMLTKAAKLQDAFVAHVGGDDFFMSVNADLAFTTALVRQITEKFARDVESFYDPADRARGGLVAIDRDGQRRLFPLMRVSASLLPLPADRTGLSQDEIVAALAEGKRRAKAAGDKIAVASLDIPNIQLLMRRLDKLAAAS